MDLGQKTKLLASLLGFFAPGTHHLARSIGRKADLTDGPGLPRIGLHGAGGLPGVARPNTVGRN